MVESADSVLDEAAVLPPVVGSCIEPSNLALAIFGAIFGTLLLCTAFALLIWYLMRTDKFQIADKLLVLERGLLRKRGDGGKAEEGEAAAAATTKRTDGRGVAEGTKRETETATTAVGHQMDGMTTELKKGCRQLEMNIGVGGVKKEGRKCEDKKEKPNKGAEEEEEEAAQKADKTEEKRAEEEEEAKTEEEEELKKKQRTKVEERGGREEEEEAKNARGEAAPEEEKPTENAVDEVGGAQNVAAEMVVVRVQPQPTNGHRFRQGCGGQPVEQNNYSKREGGNDDTAAERLGEEGRPADDEAEEGQKHSARLMTMLSAEQFGTLELNRRRLETERRQLREMGVI